MTARRWDWKTGSLHTFDRLGYDHRPSNLYDDRRVMRRTARRRWVCGRVANTAEVALAWTLPPTGAL
jgi:hypothetical protein